MRRKRAGLGAAFLILAMAAGGCSSGQAASATAESVSTEATAETAPAETAEENAVASAQAVASGEETVSPSEVVQEGMVPVYPDELKEGVYSIQVDSSSSMFRITDCELTVAEGQMTARMTMGGTGYIRLYPGTGEQAAQAEEKDCISYEETSDGAYVFSFPVEALDMGIDCSAFSQRKEKWYDRVLVFRADSLPLEAFAEGTMATPESLGLEDGSYTVEVTLEGGSGRASIQSPAKLEIENGSAVAEIVWGSANYDYMKVGEQRFDPISMEEHSVFQIPVTIFDRPVAVKADTIAMSQPHEIDYTLTFDSAALERAE